LAFLAKSAKSVLDFSLGDRGIPGIFVFATLSATLIGPGYSMGIVNNSNSDGFIWFFILIAFSIQTVLSGKFLAPKIREFDDVNTVADIVGIKYGEQARLLTGLVSFISLIGFFSAIAGAAGDIINAVLGFERELSIFVCIILVVLTSSIGGVKSVVITDTFQFAVLVIAIPVAFIFVLNSGGAAEFTPVKGSLAWNQNISLLTYTSLFVSFFLGEALIPPYVHRIIISSNESEAGKGYVYAGLFSVVWFFICVFIGSISTDVYPVSENVFVDIVKQHLPIGISGLAVAAIISIILSTLSSLLNSAVVTLNEDLLKANGFIWSSGGKELRGLQVSGILIGTVSLLFAIESPSIIEGLLKKSDKSNPSDTEREQYKKEIVDMCVKSEYVS
jgi:SSS family solute:Na+ symporter